MPRLPLHHLPAAAQLGACVAASAVTAGTPTAPVVFDTPHSGLTAADGRLSLANVPAGAHRLRTGRPAPPPGAPAQDQALQVGAAAHPPLVLKLAGVVS